MPLDLQCYTYSAIFPQYILATTQVDNTMIRALDINLSSLLLILNRVKNASK